MVSCAFCLSLLPNGSEDKRRVVCKVCGKTNRIIWDGGKFSHTCIKTPGHSVSVTKRKNIYKKGNGKCVYCQEELPIDDMTIDHVVPKSLGGSNKLSNLVPACANCNNLKGSLSESEFREIYQLKAERG